jgi:predicted RNA-binding protein (virulence factor B family)
MSEFIPKGIVSFVNHEKNYVIIEYEQNGKKKTVNGNIDEQLQRRLKEDKLIKKIHRFQIGDTVSFTLKISDRGDRMVALNIEYLYNTALDVLVNRAKTNNSFTGYLKVADDKYFVKEIDSYLFFPLPLSPWQLKPTENELNEPVSFYLENMERKDRVTARLFNNRYIAEFYTAVKYNKTKTPIEAEVLKITPHGIFLNVMGDKIAAKLPVEKTNAQLKPGDKVAVMITYMSTSRIIVERVS